MTKPPSRFEHIVTQQPPEHKCVLPDISVVYEQRKYDYGTIWRCGECSQLWILTTRIGKAVWWKTTEEVLKRLRDDG